jgi:GGDEF domain-containing protein
MAVLSLSDGTLARVSSSAGSAVYPDDGQTPAALLKGADAAMYSVKRAGGSDLRRVVRATRPVVRVTRPPPRQEVTESVL